MGGGVRRGPRGHGKPSRAELRAAGADWVRDQPYATLCDLDGQCEAMDIAACMTGLTCAEAEPYAGDVYEGMTKEMERRRKVGR